MDWRHPNVKCLFSVEKIQPAQNAGGEPKRFVKLIHNPMAHGLSTAADFDKKHRPLSWPPGTEYQYAYCSEYRDNLPQERKIKQLEEDAELQQMMLREQVKERRQLQEHDQQQLPPIDCDRKRGVPIYRLYDPSPLPILDKHYRGARYHINDPIGVYVPEELSKTKETPQGPVRISNKEDMDNIYTPNYRYKDWVDRPLALLLKDTESSGLVCKLPEAPTQFWDMYNLRMGRDKKEMVNTQPLYQTCRLIPYPMDKDLPNQPQDIDNVHLGKFNETKCKEVPFKHVVRC